LHTTKYIKAYIATIIILARALRSRFTRLVSIRKIFQGSSASSSYSSSSLCLSLFLFLSFLSLNSSFSSSYSSALAEGGLSSAFLSLLPFFPYTRALLFLPAKEASFSSVLVLLQLVSPADSGGSSSSSDRRVIFYSPLYFFTLLLQAEFCVSVCLCVRARETSRGTQRINFTSQAYRTCQFCFSFFSLFARVSSIYMYKCVRVFLNTLSAFQVISPE